MKAKDIVVGQLYGHSDHEGTIYLGSQDNRANPRKSFVIVIAGSYGIRDAGRPVRSRATLRKRFNNGKFWDKFYSLPGRLILTQD
jgi:hypothetical protein